MFTLILVYMNYDQKSAELKHPVAVHMTCNIFFWRYFIYNRHNLYKHWCYYTWVDTEEVPVVRTLNPNPHHPDLEFSKYNVNTFFYVIIIKVLTLDPQPWKKKKFGTPDPHPIKILYIMHLLYCFSFIITTSWIKCVNSNFIY